MAEWADALDHVVTEERPHGDATWVVYLTWYTPRTRTRVMYIPPASPSPLIADH
jgi:hypothetical protein